jgi:predicted transcriptional regulator of viral defense system
MIQLNKDKVRKALQATKTNVFVFAKLSELIQQHLPDWTVEKDKAIPTQALIAVKSMGVNAIVEAIVEAKVLKKAVLPFPYREDTRYLFGTVDSLDLVQSLSEVGYFSHFTAIYLNNLTEQIPKTIYFNIEQRLSGGTGHLAQASLDRAFKAQPRLSSNVVEFEGTRIVKVNGKNANQLGVSEQRRATTGTLRVTDCERTLIDATVRPAYSGGIAVVAKAFELAKKSVSVNKLAAYLRKLRYVYPYHQAVGFYMERAGYEEPMLKLLEQIPIEYDFYLQHAMHSPVLNKRWRLYVPKGF